ncbi:uncharacterized protein LOC118434510 isoform X1 [Folsomia candida]|nr:uncharacterized protein LOC118434510 isoform X1 [Folsomia candida]
MMIASIVAFASGFINLGRVIVDHCAPPFLGAYFLQCPLCSGPNPTVNYVTWIPMLTMDFYFVFTILHKGFFYPVHIVFATTGRMVDYLEVIKKSPSGVKLSRYRSVQILEAQINDYSRIRVMPAFMSGVPFVEVLSLFVIIKLHDQVPLPGFLLFPEGFITAASALIVYETVAAILNTKSFQIIGTWKQQFCRGKVKRREVRSLRPLMVKFGSNYIDKGTPLVTQDFCINQTVSMLLMKRQSPNVVKARITSS